MEYTVDKTMIYTLQFAGDQVVMAQIKEDLEHMCRKLQEEYSKWGLTRGELSYLAPLCSENISAPYFKHVSFGGGYYPPRLSQTPRLPVPRQK